MKYQLTLHHSRNQQGDYCTTAPVCRRHLMIALGYSSQRIPTDKQFRREGVMLQDAYGRSLGVFTIEVDKTKVVHGTRFNPMGRAKFGLRIFAIVEGQRVHVGRMNQTLRPSIKQHMKDLMQSDREQARYERASRGY